MVVERKLESVVQVPVYTSNADSIKGSNAVSRERPLCKGALLVPVLKIPACRTQCCAMPCCAVMRCVHAMSGALQGIPVRMLCDESCVLCEFSSLGPLCLPCSAPSHRSLPLPAPTLITHMHTHMHTHAGERAAFFLGPVPEDKLPKDATPGRCACGLEAARSGLPARLAVLDAQQLLGGGLLRVRLPVLCSVSQQSSKHPLARLHHVPCWTVEAHCCRHTPTAPSTPSLQAGCWWAASPSA
jgi:hypothetical protein